MLVLVSAVSLVAQDPVHNQMAAKEAAREYIKDHLKAPATAVFSKETVCAVNDKGDFAEASGTGTTPECEPAPLNVGTGENLVVYRASVDSQNSFGAMLRTKFLLTVGFVKGKWTFIDQRATVKLLYEACTELSKSYRQAGLLEKVRDCNSEYPSAAK
ncbi:MAG TPA: hypothetical protein VGN17_00315 [Bryobacteraceae bacterium]|jgi:hypothetical protein